jgi:flavin reductase (DIM6/NTAB) family NADH-FMN oxidoreductase RutF
MEFDFARLQPRDRYKLLISTVTPRPIAWVSTVAPDGVMNAAPFSFFNVFSDDPPVLGFSCNTRPSGVHKDTGANVRAKSCFVVNLVDEARLDQMNITAAEFEPQVDEFARAGLTAAPSVTIDCPRIAESPVSFECTLMQVVPLGGSHSLFLGKVSYMHVRDDMVRDAARCHIDTQKLHLIGRMQANFYTRTRDSFELPRVPAD